MANILLLAPTPIAAISTSRGTGWANLLTADPKEVWADDAVGTIARIDIDLGAACPIDTVFLGHVTPPAAGATWQILGGVAAHAEQVLKVTGSLRAIDAAGSFPETSHAFWSAAGGAGGATVRYIRINVTQPAGALPLKVGVAMVGQAFVPALNKEWGSGRRVIDSGTVTALPSGGFATLEGSRRGAFAWTLGDLADDEVERLYALQMDRGETRPLLVVEDPAATSGQRARIHYGLFTQLRAYERQDAAKTRWEFSIEEWV